MHAAHLRAFYTVLVVSTVIPGLPTEGIRALCPLSKARDVCGSVARACLVLLNAVSVWLVVAFVAPLGRCQRACHHHPLQSQLSRFSCEASARVWTILAKIHSAARETVFGFVL
eukprot:COSAG03_NODE_2343_length_2866_cov_1.628117_3_plen_114_part_00